MKSFSPPVAARRLTASVRVRSTIAGTAVILVGSIVGSILLIVLLQRTLSATVEGNADTRAAEVARLVVAADHASLAKDLEENTSESQVVQVVDAQGAVVASSSVRASGRPLSLLRPRPGATMRADKKTLSLLRTGEPYAITVLGVSVGGQTETIVVASTVASQRESIETLLAYLLLLVPAGGVLVAIGMWVLVGRSLRPVERIRSRVAMIRAGGLGDRVPVPDSHDEIARLATTMNEMLERLDAGHRVQRTFVSNASHELRSPLASLSASLDVVGDSPTGERWAETKDAMTSEVARMVRLVDDLLLLAKVDDPGLVPRTEEVDLDDVVDEEVRRLRSHERVAVTAAISPVRVQGDRGQLAQVVRNLVENAAVAAASSVHVVVVIEDGEARITVEDDGGGVPESQRERVFERFVRLDDSRSRASGGSGLGLAIVREIVVGHRGTVTITDASPHGARFVVRLPLGQPPVGSNR